MSDNTDAETNAIIDAVAERSGLSRAIVSQVVEHIRAIVPNRDDTRAEPPRDARRLAEIQLEPDSKVSYPPDIDGSKFSSNRSKLGGEAEWIQEPQNPVCCGRFATFYGQIDTNLGSGFCIADAGILYVFVCEECLSARTELQYY